MRAELVPRRQEILLEGGRVGFLRPVKVPGVVARVVERPTEPPRVRDELLSSDEDMPGNRPAGHERIAQMGGEMKRKLHLLCDEFQLCQARGNHRSNRTFKIGAPAVECAAASMSIRVCAAPRGGQPWYCEPAPPLRLQLPGFRDWPGSG